MAWLIACPHHRPGIFGLVYFFVIIFFQPNLHGFSYLSNLKSNSFFLFGAIGSKYLLNNTRVTNEFDIFFQFTYYSFLMAIIYATTFLPYGRFYNRLGGNVGLLLSYLYIFIFLGVPAVRRSSMYIGYKNSDISLIRIKR